MKSMYNIFKKNKKKKKKKNINKFFLVIKIICFKILQQ